MANKDDNTSVERILERVSPRGTWQMIVFLQLLVTLAFFVVLVYEESYLLAGGMQHRCIDNGVNASWASVGTDEQCVVDIDPASCGDSCGVAPKCDNFEYQSQYYDATMVKSFDLVCDRRGWVPTYKSMFLFGWLALPFWGWASDRFGRRPVLIITAPGICLSAIALSQSTTLWMALLSRCMLGAFQCGYWKTAFIMNMELAVEKRRNLMAILLTFNWPVGGVIAGLLGYLIRDWRLLHAYSVIPALLSIPLSFLLPESPRWLITNGRYEQAIRVLHRAARFGGNPKAVPGVNTLKSLHDAHHRTVAAQAGTTQRSVFGEMIGSSVLFRRTLILVVQWNMALFAFFGIFYYSTGGVGGGSPYLQLWLTGLFRCLAYYPLIMALDRFGKRNVIFATLAGTAALMSCLAALPRAPEYVVWGIWIQVGAVVVSDLAVSAIYAFTSELYPTVMRQTGLSVCSGASRVGAFTSPYAADLLGQFWRPLPAVVFGSCAFVGAVQVYFLPETNEKRLADTVEDVDDDDHALRVQ